MTDELKEEENNVGISFKKSYEELEKENEELKEQIEKLKCCENCKHINDSNTDYYCEDCKRFANETNIEKMGVSRMTDLLGVILVFLMGMIAGIIIKSFCE